MMTQLLTILAQGRNEGANQWLDEHPIVLGSIALVLGLVLLGFGIAGLKKGTTADKRGKELSGGSAQAMSILRLVAGVVCTGFGLYKMVAG